MSAVLRTTSLVIIRFLDIVQSTNKVVQPKLLYDGHLFPKTPRLRSSVLAIFDTVVSFQIV